MFNNLDQIFWQFNLTPFELENGVTMSPRRSSFLSLIFTCLNNMFIIAGQWTVGNVSCKMG